MLVSSPPPKGVIPFPSRHPPSEISTVCALSQLYVMAIAELLASKPIKNIELIFIMIFPPHSKIGNDMREGSRRQNNLELFSKPEREGTPGSGCRGWKNKHSYM